MRAASTGTWKEFRFRSTEAFQRMESILRGQRGLPDGTVWRFEDGPNVLVTNMGLATLRRFARLDGVRLPEHVTLRFDDPIVEDICSEYNAKRRAAS